MNELEKNFFFLSRPRHYQFSGFCEYNVCSSENIEQALLRRDLEMASNGKDIKEILIGYTEPVTRGVTTLEGKTAWYVDHYVENYPDSLLFRSPTKYNSYQDDFAFVNRLKSFLKAPENSNVLVCYLDHYNLKFPDYFEKMLKGEFGFNLGEFKDEEVPTGEVNRIGYTHAKVSDKTNSVYATPFGAKGKRHVGEIVEHFEEGDSWGGRAGRDKRWSSLKLDTD